ncbi:MULTISPECIES: hypothetical protein [unclassified Nocardioides]|uniref:hypothetical protein n=1 Tax=unclassified Nocardioides TaxID=2615069 RepID=UPI0007034800|nr:MULTISPECIES: hypothetical protein [unclassified Nocardioides]KRC53842.1 hypothetical protein ASE19_07070 [Nocardioides sp. Root79]KRC71178.1 hypothetical protein ASE20_09485 [Nocardioides sp. Root240]
MNTTTRTALRLLIATPLAASAIAFGGGVAHADVNPNGPVVIAQPDAPKGPGDIANPTPTPQPDPPAPQPQGPGDIAQPDKGDDPKPQPNPQGPGDIKNPNGGGDPEPNPHGPGDITNPEDGDDPKPDGPDDITNPVDGDKPDQPEDNPAEDADLDTDFGDGVDVANGGGLIADTSDVEVPSRIDAGAASADTQDEQGMSLVWVLAGGGVVTAAGSVLARQRLARRTR